MLLSDIQWTLIMKNFKPSEFKCPCGCTKVGNIDETLGWILQAVRNKYGAVEITCGNRCQKYNDSLQGSVKNSYHIKKKAVDFYIKGKNDTKKGREEVIAYMKTLPNFKYAYHNDGTKAYMGKAIHIEVN